MAALGLGHYGEDVLISRKASLYGASRISLGSHVRIDDFCVLSGPIRLGDHVHIAAAALLFAGEPGITVGDYSSISSHCAVYAQTDDYRGPYLSNPTVPEKYTHVTGQPVEIGPYALIGTGSTLLPGVRVAEGCSVGAMSLVNKSTLPWGLYYGIPARRMGERSRALPGLAHVLGAEEGRYG